MPQPWDRQETVRPETGQPARGGLGVALVLWVRWRAWRRIWPAWLPHQPAFPHPMPSFWPRPAALPPKRRNRVTQ